jgi:uncharacterized repeat protein (TIGR02543 family)
MAIFLTGVLGSAVPAQATDSKTIVANQTVPTAELVRGKTLVVTGFAPNSTSLTAAMQKRIERFIENNPDFDFVRCLGFADRSGTPATNKRLGVERATAGCDVAVEANPDVEVSRQAGKWNREFTGADIRRVSITLSNYATANITTTFNANGAATTPAKRVKAGDSKILPTLTRPGFIFLGWFNQQVAGSKIGDGGATYVPRKSQTLWAQWTSAASSSSGSVASPPNNQVSTSQLTFNFRLGINTPAIVIANRGDAQAADFVTGTVSRFRTDFCGGQGVFTATVFRADDSGAPTGSGLVLVSGVVPTCDATRIGNIYPQPGENAFPGLTNSQVNLVPGDMTVGDGVLAQTIEVPAPYSSRYLVVVDFGNRAPLPNFDIWDFSSGWNEDPDITGRFISDPLSGSAVSLNLTIRLGSAA